MRTLLDGMACIWLQTWRAIGDADMMVLFSFALSLSGTTRFNFVLNSIILFYTTKKYALLEHTFFNQNLHTLTARCRTILSILALGSNILSTSFAKRNREGSEAVSNQYQLPVVEKGWKALGVVWYSSYWASFLSFREEPTS